MSKSPLLARYLIIRTAATMLKAAVVASIGHDSSRTLASVHGAAKVPHRNREQIVSHGVPGLALTYKR
jgi:hypothetical protein